jgi:hypothetical protein
MRIKLVLVLVTLAAATLAARASAFPFIPSWEEPADGNVAPEIRAGGPMPCVLVSTRGGTCAREATNPRV